jgi:hypothetical protein
MRRRQPPREYWPPYLAEFDPAQWVDRYHWAMARWEYWKAHPQLHEVVSPIDLLCERREARLEAHA